MGGQGEGIRHVGHDSQGKYCVDVCKLHSLQLGKAYLPIIKKLTVNTRKIAVRISFVLVEVKST